MIASFGLKVHTLVSNTNTSTTTEEGDGFGAAMLNFLVDLSARPILPHVLSLSLGSLSPVSCHLLCEKAHELMNHSWSACEEFLQQQRQVCMFMSPKQGERINHALQVLALRGVSIFGSSGDGGSHFSFERFPDSTQLGKDLNRISCDYGMPVFPTASPYITSVGGEVWQDDDPSQPVAWNRGGGGFAWAYARPSHQDRAVEKYLSRTSTTTTVKNRKEGKEEETSSSSSSLSSSSSSSSSFLLPPASSFNASGRGYPDISGVSQDGTSQSAPLVAGIFSLVVDRRLAQGLPSLGFLGPRLYTIMETFSDTLPFQDIVEGTTAFECSMGFEGATGWDPVTGWGRPVWKHLLTHFGSDDGLTELRRRWEVMTEKEKMKERNNEEEEEEEEEEDDDDDDDDKVIYDEQDVVMALA